MDKIGKDMCKSTLLYLKSILKKNYRDKIVKIKSTDSLFVSHLGEDNPDVIIYYINIDYPYSGWFVLMDKLYRALVYADMYRLVPVVRFENSELYSEADDIVDNINLFECFFNQYQNYKTQEVLISKNVVFMETYHMKTIPSEKVFDQDNLTVRQLGTIIRKYIRLNQSLMKYINNNNVVLGEKGKVIGVHVRGTDYKAGYRGHPVYVPVEDYIKKVRDVLDKNDCYRIFLATDEVETIELFNKEFHDILIYNDVYRAKENGNIGMHCTIGEEPRKNHKHMLVNEVMLDMLSLSYCDVLIGSKSNVVYNAILYKKSRNERYENVIILDYGINKRGKESKKTMKNNLIIKSL